MATACRAELSQLQPVLVLLLILCARVIAILTLRALQCDDIAHTRNNPGPLSPVRLEFTRLRRVGNLSDRICSRRTAHRVCRCSDPANHFLHTWTSVSLSKYSRICGPCKHFLFQKNAGDPCPRSAGSLTQRIHRNHGCNKPPCGCPPLVNRVQLPTAGFPAPSTVAPPRRPRPAYSTPREPRPPRALQRTNDGQMDRRSRRSGRRKTDLSTAARPPRPPRPRG